MWLGAWHRGCPAEQVEATFIVTEPTGREVRVSRKVNTGDYFGVRYPSDFGSAFTSGMYAWRCQVHDRVVAKGRFEWEGVEGGMQLTVLKP